MDTTEYRSGDESRLRTEQRVPQAGAGERPAPSADALIAEAKRIFALQRQQRWLVANTTAPERIIKLKRLRDAIVRHRADVYAAMHADFRKPKLEVELSEIRPTLAEIGYAIKHVKKWMRPRRVPTPWLFAGSRSEVRYEPKGVVLILAPWNYPFGLLLTPLVAAVAAGNCAVLRPSEKVPRTAEVLTAIVRAAFDEREVACLTEPGVTLATALTELPFDHVFFTGSTRIGRLVMSTAAKHLAGVTLELGGKSPLIIDETADIAAAAERALWGKFFNAGQTCIAPDYAVVHESKLEAFVAAAQRAVGRFYGASEEDRQGSPDFTRVIDEAAFSRLQTVLAATLSGAARVELGGRTDPRERYIAPTVVTGVGWDAPIMREEIFGPILPVLTYRDLGEVIERIRAGGKPLAMYLFSRSQINIERVLRNTSSGAVEVNNALVHYAHPHLPFGGIGESGLGSYHGWYGFRTFSHERSVLVQRRGNLARMLYPPYKRSKERLLRVLGRLS